MWTKIIIAKAPDWQQWHREIMSPRQGRGMLKVWFDGYTGIWRTSLNYPSGAHTTTCLEQVGNACEAKAQALDWAMGKGLPGHA
jgi:hypothetical protein